MNRTDFIRLLRILSRRRWLALAVVIVTLAVVTAVAFIMPQYYRSTVVVMPSQAAIGNPLNISPTVFADGYRINRFDRDAGTKVFMGLVKTPEVLRRAVEGLELDMAPKQLSKFVVLEPAFGTAFGITALAKEPEEAVRLANGMAQTLREYYREESLIQASENQKLLKERLEKIRIEMDKAQQDVEKLQGSSIILPSAQERNNPFTSRLVSLQSDIYSARADISELQERIARTEAELAKQPSNTISVISTSDTPLTRQLQSELARLEQELVTARTRYTDKHREVVRLREQIDRVKYRLEQASQEMESQKTVSPNPLRSALESDLVRLRIDEGALREKISALSNAIADTEGKLRASGGDKAVQLAARIADYEAAQEAYRKVSELLQASTIEQESGNDIAEIKIVQRAAAVDGPAPRSGPTRQEILILGILLSAVLGITSAVAAEALDSSLRTTEQVEEMLHLPLSATVPEIIGEERKALAQITRSLPISPYAECYRFLRTSVFSSNGGNTKSLMLTSASPSQGNSTTIANLAISIAEAGKRVILVDVDLRRPVQHHNFEVDNSVGLTSFITGKADLKSAIKATDIEGLFLLPAGPNNENPSALVNSQQMRELIQRLKQEFEYVLIDTPPVLAFSDSVTLSAMLDRTILVVRVGDSSRGNELQAKMILEKAGAKILGVVVNGLSSEHIDSFHFHAHYYQRPALPSPAEKNDEEIQEGNQAP